MSLLNHALRGAQHTPLAAAGGLLRQTTLLVLGGGGTLGSAVLAEALVAGRFARVMAVVAGPLASALRGLVPLPLAQLHGNSGRPLQAEVAVIVFERQRHSNGRDAAFAQPQPADLLLLAQRLLAGGVRHLIVLVPHAPALLPQALRHGLASLDEGAVAALGFEHLVFVRAAQHAAAPRQPHALQRFAGWWLSQLRLMIAQQEQPVRAVALAHCVVQLARQLPAARPGTRVLAPEWLWQAAQHEAGLEGAMQDWLQGGTSAPGPVPTASPTPAPAPSHASNAAAPHAHRLNQTTSPAAPRDQHQPPSPAQAPLSPPAPPVPPAPPAPPQ